MQAEWRKVSGPDLHRLFCRTWPGAGKGTGPTQTRCGSRRDAMGKQSQEVAGGTWPFQQLREEGCRADARVVASSAVLRGLLHPCRKQRRGTHKCASEHEPKHHIQTPPCESKVLPQALRPIS